MPNHSKKKELKNILLAASVLQIFKYQYLIFKLDHVWKIRLSFQIRTRTKIEIEQILLSTVTIYDILFPSRRTKIIPIKRNKIRRYPPLPNGSNSQQINKNDKHSQLSLVDHIPLKSIRQLWQHTYLLFFTIRNNLSEIEK